MDQSAKEHLWNYTAFWNEHYPGKGLRLRLLYLGSILQTCGAGSHYPGVTSASCSKKLLMTPVFLFIIATTAAFRRWGFLVRLGYLASSSVDLSEPFLFFALSNFGTDYSGGKKCKAPCLGKLILNWPVTFVQFPVTQAHVIVPFRNRLLPLYQFASEQMTEPVW